MHSWALENRWRTGSVEELTPDSFNELNFIGSERCPVPVIALVLLAFNFASKKLGEDHFHAVFVSDLYALALSKCQKHFKGRTLGLSSYLLYTPCSFGRLGCRGLRLRGRFFRALLATATTFQNSITVNLGYLSRFISPALAERLARYFREEMLAIIPQ